MPHRPSAILLALLLPLLAGAAPAVGTGTAAKPPAITWHIVQLDQRRYVPITDAAAFYRMAPVLSTAKKFRLTAKNRVIEGTAGTSEVRINGVKYVTCFPLRSRADRVYISAMDVTKIIEPLMRPGKIQGVKQIRTIVLDAGHGGHDSGAVGRYGREKDYTLDVVLRARALLLRAGFQVKTTRTSDTFIPLEERARFANKFTGALFISVHFNKSNSGGTGIETYALAPRGVPSMDEASLRYSDFRQNPGNARDAENIALAAATHSMLVRYLPLTDRGIKRARFLVIKNITIPGVLIEGGFVDNSLDARYIAMPPYRQRIAQSIADAATAYTRTITGAAPQPSATITVGPQPTPLPTLEEVLATIPDPAKTDAAPPPSTIAPSRPAYRPSGDPKEDATPAYNPGNPAFGRPPAPFDAWTLPPPPVPFSTVNPFAPPSDDAEEVEATEEAPPENPVAEEPNPATPEQTDPAAEPTPDPRPLREKPARPHRDRAEKNP